MMIGTVHLVHLFQLVLQRKLYRLQPLLRLSIDAIVVRPFQLCASRDISMWAAGVSQGLLWLSVDEFGQLSFSFREIMAAMSSYYGLRLIAGLIFFVGTLLMGWNLFMTMRGQKTIEVIPGPVAEKYRINSKPESADDHIGTGVPA